MVNNANQIVVQDLREIKLYPLHMKLLNAFYDDKFITMVQASKVVGISPASVARILVKLRKLTNGILCQHQVCFYMSCHVFGGYSRYG